MKDIRHEANEAAQEAWRAALDNHSTHHRWDPVLVAALHDAERWVDAVEAAEWLPEYLLDALHEATSAELVELADAEGLPDIPLAAWAETELANAYGDR